ncbi:MAG TPA: DUF6510 family protein [Candidatus Dormibacteraeota bacterium]
MKQSELKLDGNAIAGVLAEIFAVEMTAVEGTCAGCGNVAPMGAVDVYANAPGIVVRCPACAQVLITIVRAPGRTWLDLGGLRRLQLVT